MRKFDLKLKRKKCEFIEAEIVYLGFIVSKDGIKVDPNCFKAIKEMRPPRDVRGFIGTASWYRRFCPHFSEIAAPLIALTKKHARFIWSKECQLAFDQLKRALTTAPTLAYPDPTKP